MDGNAALSGQGGGIACAGIAAPEFKNVIISNSFLSNAVLCGEGLPVFRHCCLFGNQNGDDVCGVDLGNISADPLYCDRPNHNFTLNSTSPCHSANNEWGEVIGAYDVACGPNPVEGSFLAALLESGHVELRWAVGSLAGIESFNVHRATSADGPFAKINTDPIPPSSPCEYEDGGVWPETTFWYRLTARFYDGTEDVVGPALASVTTGGRLEPRVYPPRPNPFRASTSIQFDVPDHAGPVKLSVYDASGRLVATLIDGDRPRGRWSVPWSGSGDSGRRASSGVYFVRYEVQGHVETQKLLLLR